MVSIRLISCYFGTLKPEIYLWLKSCGANSDISFLFVTDQKLDNVPDNVTVLHISFGELKNRIEKALDMQVSLPRPYKLCDFKVAYGMIFSQELENFEYWGYCDSDMVLGDIRKFLTDELLSENEKVLSLGHLSVYRNTPEVCGRFMAQDDIMNYKNVFSNEEIFQFDETPGIYRKYIEHGWKFCKYVPFLDVVWNYNKRLTRYLYAKRLYNENVNIYPWQIYYYEDGKVMEAYSEDGNTIRYNEYLYIHSSKRSYDITGTIPEHFYFLPGKIQKKKRGDVTWSELRVVTKRFNCKIEKLEQQLLEFIYRVKRKIGWK